MMIQLDERLVKQLEDIAHQQGRDTNLIVQELIEDFLKHQAEIEFDTKIDRIMQEHAELLDKLGKKLMRYLNIDEVIRINKKVHDGQAQVRDRALLESAIARPMASAFGQDAYFTVLEKAAALLHSLVMNHPFVDGNKRTAAISTVFFLEENGLRVTWSADEAHLFIVAIAEQQHDVPQITHWLSEHTKSLDT